jgi:hypothetical protein
MLKRSLFTAALAASTLLVTGTAQASAAAVRAPAQPNPANCIWKDGCYKCYDYRTARWTIQHCDGDGG